MSETHNSKTNRVEFKVAICIALIGLLGGVIAASITSIYQDKVSKREIALSTIDFLSKSFLQEKPILLTENLDKNDLNQILQYKETAFMARQLTQQLSEVDHSISFDQLRAGLTSIERRYSYAQIYQASGQARIICENIQMRVGGTPLKLGPYLSKCESSELDDLMLSIAQDDQCDAPDNNCMPKIDTENYRFNLSVKNDQGRKICKGQNDSCSFWIDLGDRLESTPYEFLILAEYIGFTDVFHKKDKVVTFSIIQRAQPVVDYPPDVAEITNP